MPTIVTLNQLRPGDRFRPLGECQGEPFPVWTVDHFAGEGKLYAYLGDSPDTGKTSSFYVDPAGGRAFGQSVELVERAKRTLGELTDDELIDRCIRELSAFDDHLRRAVPDYAEGDDHLVTRAYMGSVMVGLANLSMRREGRDD